MLKRLVVSVITGVVGSVIAYVLIDSFTNSGGLERWGIAVASGVALFALLAFASREAPEEKGQDARPRLPQGEGARGEIGNRIRGRDINVKGDVSGAGHAQVGNDLDAVRDVNVTATVRGDRAEGRS